MTSAEVARLKNRIRGGLTTAEDALAVDKLFEQLRQQQKTIGGLQAKNRELRARLANLTDPSGGAGK